MVFANAGVSEETDYFADTFDDNGALEEPEYGVLGVNLRAVLNVIKLGWNRMRRDNVAGSIVVTTSATAYAPEQSLPVYSAAKLAVCFLELFHTTLPPQNPSRNAPCGVQLTARSSLSVLYVASGQI